ncbi:MAG: isopentenyl phosphate kinase family protein [Chloroflexi bacterium]|nr:isopentenyl phosphate kinase family protein [Chloroflexota bacterium]
MKTNLIFLKLGGSLITDKTLIYSPRLNVITRLAGEIQTALLEMKDCSLVLGHGSGSFGHVAAKKHDTRNGVASAKEWRGFTEVGYQAASLNLLVMGALQNAGLSALSFSPSATVIAQNGQVTSWNLNPIMSAINAGVIPVVYGDVVFDTHLGGTILSTEDIFLHLARALRPQRILLAGIEEGVWADYPTNKEIMPNITKENWKILASAITGSASTDVTGGMASKVQQMLTLVQDYPDLEVFIFDGKKPGNVAAALKGKPQGTQLIHP